MSEERSQNVAQNHTQETPAPKKLYRKPDFQYENVFETMALACGKLAPTQAQCHFNRKNS